MASYGQRQLSIFLLDDHDIVRQGLQDLLSRPRDMLVIGETGSARRAIKLIPELRPDLMVLDLRLQDGTGIEVCRQVRAVDPAIQGLILTSSDDDEALAAALMAGAVGYVVKLAHSDKIIEAIRRIGARQPLMDRRSVDRVRSQMLSDLQTLSPPATGPEYQVATLVLDGLTDSEIASRTATSPETVGGQVAGLIERMSVTVAPSLAGSSLSTRPQLGD